MTGKWGCGLAGILVLAVCGPLPANGEGQVFRIGPAAGNVIVTCPDEPGNIASYNRRFAARELSGYLKRITGAEIPVTDTVEEKQIESGGVIFVGPSRYTDTLNISRERVDLGAGGYLIKTTGKNLAILGDDSGGYKVDDSLYGEAGTYYGTTVFLERFGGVRWLWPGEDGTVVPEKKTLSVPRMELRSRPAYLWRTFGTSPDVRMRKADGTKETGEQLRQWVLFHRRHGGGSSVPLVTGHYLDTYVKRDDFGIHPEYFSFYDGKRQPWVGHGKSWQVCNSNPDVVKLFVDDIVKACPPGGGGFSISPNDGYGFCLCDKCKAMDKGSKPWPEDASGFAQIPGALYNDKYGAAYDISNRIWTFNNEVAGQVAQRAPLARLSAYAYSCYTQPPADVLHIEDNIQVIICDWLVTGGPSSEFKKGWEIFTGWGERTEHLGLYGYYFGQTCRPHQFVEFLRKFHNLHGVTHYAQTSQAWGNRWSEYVLGLKALWNPNLDPDAVLDEYLSAGFGPGRTAMRKYLDLYERVSLSDYPSNIIPDRKVWTSEVRVELRTHLDEALRAIKGSEYERRVRFVEEGWELLDSVSGLAGSAAELRGMGLAMPGFQPGEVAPIHATPEETRIEIRKAVRYFDRLSAVMKKVEDKKSFAVPWLSRNLYSGGHWRVAFEWGRALEGFQAALLKGSAVSLPIMWRFRTDFANEGERNGWFQPTFDDSGWVSIRTDASWEDQGFGRQQFPDNGTDGYNGRAWYRIKVLIPESRRGGKARLELGAVDESFTAWVNGRKCAVFDFEKQPNKNAWQEPQVFDITEAVRYGQDNLIAVAVDDRTGAGGIWKQCFLRFSE